MTTGWAVVASLQPRDFARDMLVCFGMPNTDWRQCDVRASAKGRQMACCSRACSYPAAALLCQFGPTSAFQIGLGLANRRRREGHWQPTSVTALGGILVGDGRVAAGVLGPAMSDGESGFPANYSRSGPTIIRDYSRRPRRGRAHTPDYGAAEPGLRSHWPRIKVGSGNLNRGRRQLKPGPEAT